VEEEDEKLRKARLGWQTRIREESSSIAR